MDALTRLHLGLTRGRELVGTDYLDDPALLAAYEAHFCPMSYAKARAVLREVFPEGACGRRPGRIADLGSGPGPMARAARELFPGAQVLACDRSRIALSHVPDGIKRICWDLAREAPPPEMGPQDLLLLGNVLGELPGDGGLRLERLADRLLAPEGTVVVIEPALRETARALERARDGLIARGWFVVAPCLWRGPCPALERERDWCHEDRSERGGDETLKFAYLVLRRQGSWSDDERLFRLISARMDEKGKQKRYGCGPAGRHLLVRLRRHVPPEAWDEAERGDIARMEGLEEKTGELRLGPEAAMRIVQKVVR